MFPIRFKNKIEMDNSIRISRFLIFNVTRHTFFIEKMVNLI